MELGSNTVLVTGGASGIGYGFVEQARNASRADLGTMFERINQRR